MATSISKIVQLTNEIKLGSEALDLSSEPTLLQEKQKLLAAANELVEKLEGPEPGIWKVVFGVSKS